MNLFSINPGKTMHSTHGIRKTAFSSVIPLAGWLLAGLLGGAGVRAGQVDLAPPPDSVAFGTNITVFPNGNFLVLDPYRTVNGMANVGAIYLYHGATLTNISILTGSHANDFVGYGGVQLLTNNTILVFSPNWANGTATNAGAITWMNATNGPAGGTGVSNVLSSANSLVGASANDSAGFSLIALPNGNYVIQWPTADDPNNNRPDIGAATWYNPAGGTVGTLSTANSLFGAAVSVTPLANGHYVVRANNFVNGDGSVTWCNGTTPSPVGYVSTGNSLYGNGGMGVGAAGGAAGITPLSNGNYVVSSYNANGQPGGSYASTWCSGTGPTAANVNTGNSIYGTHQNAGYMEVKPLPNGNYLLVNPNAYLDYAYGVGCVRWVSGSSQTQGVMPAGSYLRGNCNWNGSFYEVDLCGNGGVTVMPDSSFVIYSASYAMFGRYGALTYAGPSGSLPNGPVSYINSLCGAAAGDLAYCSITVLSNNAGWLTTCPNFNGRGCVLAQATSSSYNGWTLSTSTMGSAMIYGINNDRIGLGGIKALPNGRFVVCSPAYGGGLGALTLGRSDSMAGGVSSGNSMVGGVVGGYPCYLTVTADSISVLNNGNFVYNTGVNSQRGAMMWGSSNGPLAGTPSSGNVLMGSSGSYYGITTPTALTNGDYLVASSSWDDGTNVNAGVLAYCNGLTGRVGTLSAANALVGAAAGDMVGSTIPAMTASGGFVVASYSARAGGIANAGCVNYYANSNALTGVLATTSGLTGGSRDDQVGSGGLTLLTNGYCMVRSPVWDNGVLTNVGAVSLINLASNFAGVVSQCNSVLGTVSGAGGSMSAAFDYANAQMIVGHGRGNRVTVMGPGRTNQDTTLTAQPLSQNVTVGGTVTFSVTVTGTGPFTYQWLKGGLEIAGATK